MVWRNKSYQTLINHFLLAGTLTFVFSLVVPVKVAAGLAIWGYAFRECEQQLRNWQEKNPINAFDAVLDVAVPAVSSVLVWLWLR